MAEFFTFLAIVAAAAMGFKLVMDVRSNNEAPISSQSQRFAGKSAAVLRREAREELGIDTSRYNLVFCGGSGTGKSSLVNAVLGLDASSHDGAAVGETETTMAVSAYNSSRFKHLTVWDSPGAGTVTNPGRDYFMQKRLYAFDVVVVVVASRFRELDLAIVEAGRHFDVPVTIVRSKSDADLDTRYRRLRRRNRRLRRCELRGQLRNDTLSAIRRQLVAAKLEETPVFYVSSLVLDGTLPEEEYGIDEAAFFSLLGDTIKSRRQNATLESEFDRPQLRTSFADIPCSPNATSLI